MDELESVRQKRFAELEQQQEEHQQLEQQLSQLESVVKSKFTKDALQRFGNIKAAYPEKAVQVLLILGQALQSKQIQEIDDELLKKLLGRITEKKEMKITRR